MNGCNPKFAVFGLGKPVSRNAMPGFMADAREGPGLPSSVIKKGARPRGTERHGALLWLASTGKREGNAAAFGGFLTGADTLFPKPDKSKS